VIFDRKCYGGFKAFGTIDGEKKTSLLRHAFVEIPAVSVVKIEMKKRLSMNNEFMVTFLLNL
jgi:hypothetical protein